MPIGVDMTEEPKAGGIQVDVWGGTLHQNLMEEHLFEDWKDAADLIQSRVEAGCLCNVLHTDYRPPAGEQAEAMEAALTALAIEHLGLAPREGEGGA